MRILFLCAAPPRPDGSSDSVIAYNRIRILIQRGHKISLACFLSGSSESYPRGLETMVEDMELLPPPKTGPARRAWGFLRYLVGMNPFAGRTSQDMQKLVGRLVERTHCDVLMAESAAMGPYLFENPFLPAVHRVVSRQGVSVPLHSSALSFCGYSAISLRDRMLRRAIEAYELRLYRFVDHVVTLTFHERLQLLRRCPELNVSVTPYGIDVRALPCVDSGAPATQLLMVGCYTESADIDDTRWFLRETWPRLSELCPELNLCICGRNATKQFRSYGGESRRVRLVDAAADIPEEEVAASQLFVSPMRTEAGFQGRVLRMLGSGLAVVASSRAVEGIAVQTGANIFLADTPHTMTEALHLLVNDVALRRTLGRQARELVARNFSWQRSVDGLEQVLQSVVA